MGKRKQDAIVAVLSGMDAAVIYTNRDEFEKRLNSAFKDAGLKIEAPLRKAVLNAFSE